MPVIRKVDAIEAAWDSLLDRVGSVGEEIPELARSSSRYWALINLLRYPEDAWADPNRANAVGWLAANTPHLVRRLAYRKSGHNKFLYQLTSEGRALAQRLADYETRRQGSA